MNFFLLTVDPKPRAENIVQMWTGMFFHLRDTYIDDRD